MRTLDWMVVRTYLPVLVVAVTFFVLILELVDLFSNLVRFINLEIPFSSILDVQILYLPKALSFALPIAVLFAAAFTLGAFYSNNELVSVFGAGVPLSRFVLPVIVSGLILSVFSFWFDENVVIDTLQQKNVLTRQLLNVNRSFSNTNVTVLSADQRTVYNVDYYNDNTQTLSGVLILQRNRDDSFRRRVDAEWADWNGTVWVLHNARVFEWDDREEKLTEEHRTQYLLEGLDALPQTFKRTARDIDEMHLRTAAEWINSLKSAGLPYRRALTKYHERFSFALTPFIVTLISTAIGGRFRKNILLMSLLVSLIVSVLYYVIGMIAGLLAFSGTIQPVVGAWTAFVVFLATGLMLFRFART